jgi:hypothetical protein
VALSGRIQYENLSATKVSEDRTEVDHGPGYAQFGDTVVPRRVAYTIEGDHSSPSLRIEFEIRDERPFCSSVHIDASAQGRSIRTGDLTSLPSLERLAEECFAELAMRAGTSNPFEAFIGDKAGVRQARGEIHSGGDAELKEVARVYREHVDERPVEAVEALGYTRRTAARRIQQAREKGLLPKTTQGKRKA